MTLVNVHVKCYSNCSILLHHLCKKELADSRCILCSTCCFNNNEEIKLELKNRTYCNREENKMKDLDLILFKGGISIKNDNDKSQMDDIFVYCFDCSCESCEEGLVWGSASLLRRLGTTSTSELPQADANICIFLTKERTEVEDKDKEYEDEVDESLSLFPVLNHVVIRRIAGHQYPSVVEYEDKVIHRYFQRSRLLCVGDEIFVVDSRYHPHAKLLSSDHIQSHEEPSVYHYIVESLSWKEVEVSHSTAKSLLTSTSATPRTPSKLAGVGVASLDTLDVLSLSSNQAICQRAADLRADVWLASAIQWMYRSSCSSTSIALCLRRVISNIQTRKEAVDKLLHAFTPAFRTVNMAKTTTITKRNNPDLTSAAIRTIRQSPILIQGYANDCRNAIFSTAAALGVNLIRIPLLSILYPSAGTVLSREWSDLHKTVRYSNKGERLPSTGESSSSLPTLYMDPRSIRSAAPCILLIEGMDTKAPASSATGAGKGLDRGALDEEGTKQSRAVMVEEFFRCLWSDKNSKKKKVNDLSDVVVIAGIECPTPTHNGRLSNSSSSNTLDASLKALFPSHISIYSNDKDDDHTHVHSNTISSTSTPRMANTFLKAVCVEMEKELEASGSDIGRSEKDRLKGELALLCANEINDVINSEYNSRNNCSSTNISMHNDKKVSTVWKQFKSTLSLSLGGGSSVAIAPVLWEDIGGLEDARKELNDMLSLPSQMPHLFTENTPRRQGVLLYGPPGTGKTLVARAVATESGMSFMSVKGPELLDVYVGESERRVRGTFQDARSRAPCVLFFDELDSLAPARGRGSDSGGVMDRVVSQLLTEMDDLSKNISHKNIDTDRVKDYGSKSQKGRKGMSRSVFVLGATNRPDMLDPALLRPGRFDRRVYLGPLSESASKQAVLKAQTRKMILEDDVDLVQIAEALPSLVTGSDVAACTGTAYQIALNRKLQFLTTCALGNKDEIFSNSSKHCNSIGNGPSDISSQKDMLTVASHVKSLPPQELEVRVSAKDLLDSASMLVPALSSEELHKYEMLRDGMGSNN